MIKAVGDFQLRQLNNPGICPNCKKRSAHMWFKVINISTAIVVCCNICAGPNLREH